MLIEELKKKRDELLRNAKQEKSDEYKKGYIDAALDMYNEAAKIYEKGQLCNSTR